MMRMGGDGGFPPSDPEAERKMANAALIGQVMTFGAFVSFLHLGPILLDQLGFDVLL